MMVEDNDSIVVWFSCGAASAVAAKKTIEKYGDIAKIRIVNNPIKEEDEDNQRFLKDIESWLGINIEYAINSKYPSCSCKEVWDNRNFMSSPYGASCTLELKKRARQQWEDNNYVDWHVMGFVLEETKRYEDMKFGRIDFKTGQRKPPELPELLPVLIEEKITKSDCYRIIQEAGIKLPRIYTLGYPNANCIGCVKSTSATYWNHVRKIHPLVFENRAIQSREIGAKLVKVKGKRIFLDELDPKARGRSMKNMDFECGIFCETD